MKLKDKCWKALSIYIRERDALKTTGTTDRVKCFTCNTFLDVKEAHAGHFLDGRYGYYMLDERQIHAQCPTCNMVNDGCKNIYMQRMLELYGKKVVSEIIHNPNKETNIDYEKLTKDYQEKRKNLKRH